MKPILIITALLLCGFKSGDRVYIEPSHRVVARITDSRLVEVMDWDYQRQTFKRRRVYKAVWIDKKWDRHWAEFFADELEAVK